MSRPMSTSVKMTPAAVTNHVAYTHMMSSRFQLSIHCTSCSTYVEDCCQWKVFL